MQRELAEACRPVEVIRGLASSCIEIDVLGILNNSSSSGKSGSCEDREDDEEHAWCEVGMENDP